MKIIILPDLHLTEKTPKNRKDNFEETSLKKLRFILNKAKELEVKLVLQPGDLFDTPKPSYRFYKKIVDVFKKNTETHFFTCMGQHDMKYRTKEDTALKALSSSCENLFLEYDDNYKNIFITSCSYGEEIPEPEEREDYFTILLIHKMIVGEKKLWEGQEDVTWARNFLRKHEFDLIISGDNHAQFEAEYNGRYLFNCGTLMRNGKDTMDLKPYMILFDTNKKKYEKIYIPIEPAEDVFEIDKIEREENRDKEMEAFVKGIKNSKKIGLNFKENIFSYIRENEIEKGVKNVFEEAFTSIGRKNNVADSENIN